MATIVKCSRDYQSVAWAQYDRGFRKQMAKLKDLRWSRLNTTLFSLCFAGKAKRNTVCAWCLADSHDTESCPDNPPKADWKWRGGDAEPGVVVARRSQSWGSKVCYSYNDPSGNMCNFDKCHFALRHVRRIIRGPSVGQMHLG